MNLNIQYEPLSEKYITEAMELVMAEYNQEKTEVPILPDGLELIDNIRESISSLFINGNGTLATYDNELIGFLAGFEVEELFGRCKGIYCPLYGHGVKRKLRKNLYSDLYRNAAESWVNNDIMTHALTFFAHDNETIETWFWLGFGLRCIDAIREVEPIGVNNSTIYIKKADLSDIPALADIHRRHYLYYRTSPIFMIKQVKDPIQDLRDWLKKDNHHLWVAYHADKAIGYMQIEPSAETFVSEHKTVMNITGAYVDANERESGVGAILLDSIQQWLSQNGFILCGVDFESINISGSKFWKKFFTPYTYSMVRRIDERIKI